MRGQEDRVGVGEFVRRVHVDVHVGSGRRVVPERQAPCSCSTVEIAPVSVMMPVTLEAALNDLIFSGRWAYWARAARNNVDVDVPVGILRDGDDGGQGIRARAARCCGARKGRRTPPDVLSPGCENAGRSAGPGRRD